MTLYVGTSGWQYRDWRGRFYPPRLPLSRWLEHYAEVFATVEVNNTFYRLPEESTFRDWRRRTPEDFVFVPKVSRFLTHLKRLLDPEEPAELFMSRAKLLGDKLGPLLVQLPPRMRADPERLNRALAAFPSGVRIAVEFRDRSWFVDEVKAVLSSRNAALCLADRRDEPQSPLWRTADWGYLRMHVGTSRPESCYDDKALGAWARRLAELWKPDEDVFAYFNNDHLCCAVWNARTFAEMAHRSGLRPTRVPQLDGDRPPQRVPQPAKRR